MTTDNWPKIAIIVLNWNGREDTIKCLKSIEKLNPGPHKVIVVDNGSIDDSIVMISKFFPNVHLIRNESNLGYAGGNNVGLQYCLSEDIEYVLILNNDTIVAEDLLSRFIEASLAEPALGILGPTILYFDKPDTIWSAGGKIDWITGRTEMLAINQHISDLENGGIREVDFVTGCALFLSRRVMESVGLLDERFFAYYEETEFCVRAQRAGYGVGNVKMAYVWHRINPREQELSPVVNYYMIRNRILFLLTTHAGLRPLVHTLFNYNLRILISWSILPKWRHKRHLPKIIIIALLDALTGRWGGYESRLGCKDLEKLGTLN